jgi:hypothetical protein
VRSKWIHKIKKEKVKPPHWHKYPDTNTRRGKRIDKGSIWQCKCGKQFKLKRELSNGFGFYLKWVLIEKELS